MSTADLKECASKLSLSDRVLTRSKAALQKWIDISICSTPDFADISLWSTCAIYTAVNEYRSELESPSGQDACVTLLQILRAAKVNIKSFLDYMTYIGKEFEHNTAVEDGFFATRQKYLITIGIHWTFERLMSRIFITADDSSLGKDGVPSLHHRRRVCWCFFLVAKERIPGRNKELMSSLQLMLCCINYIGEHTQSCMLKERFRTAKSDVTNGVVGACMLREITTACAVGTGWNVQEVLKGLLAVKASLLEPFVQQIQQDNPNQAIDGLPELDYLERKYREIYEKAADIDEMALLDNDPVLMPMRKLHSQPSSPATGSYENCQRVFQTPVRTSIENVQSLNAVLANAKEEPSASLLALLHEYDPNLASKINKIVAALEEIFIRKHIPEEVPDSTDLHQQRFRDGLCLYFRVMGFLLHKERAKKVNSSFIKSRLNEKTFHKCLLACSLEVVKVTHEYLASPGLAPFINKGGLNFPWILIIFNLYGYDFYKVIETFIGEEICLSEQVLTHLKMVKEFILESEAWKEGSPVFDDVLVARGLSTESQIEKVMRKCLYHCLMNLPDILKNRHLDHVLVCCVFVICKVNNKDICFEDFAAAYTKIPHAVSSTYKHTRLNCGKNGDIIQFYNLDFVPALKDFIFEIQPHEQSLKISQEPNPSQPAFNQQGSFQNNSNALKSPLKKCGQPSISSSSTQVTPRTERLLFSENEHITEKFRECNETFERVMKRTAEQKHYRSRKKLNLDVESSNSNGESTTKNNKQLFGEESTAKEGLMLLQSSTDSSATRIIKQRLVEQLTGPSKAPSAVTEKRVHNGSQYLYEHRELSGKRIRISEEDSQDISHTSQASFFLQIIQGDPLLQPTSVPTPTEPFTPVTGSSVLHEMLPAVATQSIRTGLPHHFNDTVSVLSGQQRELQSMTAHPSQHEPLLTQVAIHQSVGSEAIQQSGTFTELNPPKQVWQNGESQVRQHGSYSGGPGRSQQSVLAGMSYIPQQRGQLGQVITSMPCEVPQVRQSSQPQTLPAVQLTESQLASKVTHNDQRDSLQGGQSVDYSTSQQVRNSIGQQQMHTTQSLGPPITENSEQIIHQNESTTRMQTVEQSGDTIGQQTLQLRQADKTIGRERTEHRVHMEGYSRLNTQQNIQQTRECIQSNNVLQQDRPDTECIQSNNVLQQDRPDTEFDMGEQELVVTESRTTHETSVPSTVRHESVPTGSHVVSDQLIPVAKSHFQKLKYIHEELGHLLSSSKSAHPLQDVQRTSTVYCGEKVARKISSEYEQEAVRYLESLPEADKSALLAFQDMSDDREELVRRLVENIFTGEERKIGNCGGAGKYQKLDEHKLKRLRQVTFYLCPIRTRKQFSDKLEDKEWKRLCGVIDVANRHYRQELNRQKKGKGR